MTQDNKKIWKYCYWIDNEGLTKLKKQMLDKGIAMVQAERNPCEALKGTAGYAEPAAWDLICKYDAAPWYHASKHAGKNLVVSSLWLGTVYAQFMETTLQLSSFDPEKLPSKEEQGRLAQDQTYLCCEPKDWGNFPKEMGAAIAEGLAKMTGKSPEKFEDLLCTWTAVHANFVNPHHRAGKKFMGAPYSIADSSHISSCCVELFNLFDSKEEAMLVRPCIGAVIVKVLLKDRYYFVRLVKNTGNL